MNGERREVDIETRKQAVCRGWSRLVSEVPSVSVCCRRLLWSHGRLLSSTPNKVTRVDSSNPLVPFSV